MNKATVISRNGKTSFFIGAQSYVVKGNWIGGVTLFGDGVPVAFFFRPISVEIGMASGKDLEQVRQAHDEHSARMLGVKL